MDSAYLQLKLSIQKKAKNRAKVKKDTERKKEAGRELTQTTATTKVHKLTKPSLSFSISMFLSNLFGLCFGFFFLVSIKRLLYRRSVFRIQSLSFLERKVVHFESLFDLFSSHCNLWEEEFQFQVYDSWECESFKPLPLSIVEFLKFTIYV